MANSEMVIQGAVQRSAMSELVLIWQNSLLAAWFREQRSNAKKKLTG